jgi:hypothetical protein
LGSILRFRVLLSDSIPGSPEELARFGMAQNTRFFV